MPLPLRLQTVVDFVRKGYPQGIPPRDFPPLLALLRSRLTDEEAAEIVEDLDPSGADPRVHEAIEGAIRDVTHEPPSAAEIARVRAALAETGWEDAPDAA